MMKRIVQLFFMIIGGMLGYVYIPSLSILYREYRPMAD